MIILRRHLIVLSVALAICVHSASGQTAKLLFFRAGGKAPPGTNVIQPGITSAAQTVIPRYVSGTNFPAGQIIGWGPQSILSATADTVSTSPPNPAVVITAGYGELISQWQTQSTGTEPAVLQPIVRDITIAGYSTNDWGSGGAVNDFPYLYNKTAGDEYAGFLANATGGSMDNVTLFFIPGTAARITHPGSVLGGATKPFDRLKWNVNKLFIRRVFRGLWMNATDSHVTDVEVAGFRDYGVRLGEFQANGAIQFARLHAYGGGMSAADNTVLAGIDPTVGTTGIDSPAIWIDGDSCHGVDCYGESAPVGLYIKGSYASLDGFYSHTCSVANLVFAGAYAHIAKARIDVLGDDWTMGYDNEGSDPFQAGETLSFGGGATGRLLTLTDNGSTGTLLVRQLGGPRPADNESITGGTSGATALVNGTPTTVATRTGVKFTNQYNTLVDSIVHPRGLQHRCRAHKWDQPSPS